MNVLVKNNIEVRDMYNADDYTFSVDWLNVRLDCDNIHTLILRLIKYLPEIDIADFAVRPSGGVCFYKNGWYLKTCGYSSFVLAFDTDERGNIKNEGGKKGELYGILLSISGDGCRYINSLHNNAFADLLEAISIFNPHCSRIDMACDIFDKENMLVPMIQTFADSAYDRQNATIDLNCGLQRKAGWVTANLVYDKIVNDFTRNVTIGGRSSKKGTLQLYNKRVEIETGRLDEVSEAILNSVGNPDYWWRLEYRCKSYAQAVFENLMKSKSIYSAFFQAVSGFGEFVQKTSDCASSVTNLNKTSEKLVIWVQFLAFIQKMNEKAIHLVQFVALKYFPTDMKRAEKFCLEQIPTMTAFNLARCFVDMEYRRRVFQIMAAELKTPRNHTLWNEFKEKYCYKELGSFDEFIDDIAYQMGFDIDLTA